VAPPLLEVWVKQTIDATRDQENDSVLSAAIKMSSPTIGEQNELKK